MFDLPTELSILPLISTTGLTRTKWFEAAETRIDFARSYPAGRSAEGNPEISVIGEDSVRLAVALIADATRRRVNVERTRSDLTETGVRVGFRLSRETVL